VFPDLGGCKDVDLVLDCRGALKRKAGGELVSEASIGEYPRSKDPTQTLNMSGRSSVPPCSTQSEKTPHLFPG
jgi:hypothetical protein